VISTTLPDILPMATPLVMRTEPIDDDPTRRRVVSADDVGDPAAGAPVLRASRALDQRKQEPKLQHRTLYTLTVQASPGLVRIIDAAALRILC
jgi:hypothetical protein